MTAQNQMLRLAMRHEGPFWNAYLAKPDTMDGSQLIGSIAFGLVSDDPVIKADFMALMQRAMLAALKSIGGTQIGPWDIRRAPEHERSGRA